MNSSSGSAGAPCSTTHSLKAVQMSRWVRSYSARNAPHSLESSAGRPLNTGAMPSPFTSSGLQETMRTNGLPAVSSAGKVMTLSSTITSGFTRSMIALSCGSQYFAPSMSASQIGLVTVSSCARVDLRYSGAVSRMKSFQNWPASCSSSAGGARSTRSSSKPSAVSLPFHDASAANTTRWPRRRRMSPMPTQLFVGP